jgi:outer membrane protein
MKKLLLFPVLWMILLAITPYNLTAQKFGYLSSSTILAEMPEVRQMQENLNTLQTQLQKQGQELVENYKQKEEAAIKKEEAGMLSPMEKETVLKELQSLQQSILDFEKQMQQNIFDKEQELLEPILNKVNQAIDAVSKENGYSMIFESSVLLFGEDALDVTDLVKAKLGL